MLDGNEFGSAVEEDEVFQRVEGSVSDGAEQG